MVITLNSEKNASSRRLLLPPSFPTAPRILNPESVYLLFWIAESSRSAFGIGDTSAGVICGRSWSRRGLLVCKCGDCGGYFLTSFRIFLRTHTTQRQNYRNSTRSPRTLSGTPYPVP